MGQSTSTEPMSSQAAGAESNGFGPQIQAVERARERLGRDLDQLTVEVRATMGEQMEKATWKAAATMAAVVAGIAARNGLMAVWKAARKSDPPNNPAAPDTEWMEALGWTIVTGIGVGIARLVATRGAAEGWRRFMGVLPPGLQDVG